MISSRDILTDMAKRAASAPPIILHIAGAVAPMRSNRADMVVTAPDRARMRALVRGAAPFWFPRTLNCHSVVQLQQDPAIGRAEPILGRTVVMTAAQHISMC